jgi:hypothetical protein
MKTTTPKPVHETVWIDRPDGSRFQSTKKVEFTPVPAAPRDWDVISTRVAVGLVLTLTAVAVAWSTWSIGALLHGGMGFLAALVFDLSWATCLIMEWKARFDHGKRAFPRRLGWVLLVVTMGAIFWHGAPDWRLATVGALTSAMAKALWLGIMKHIDRELSQLDRDDLADRLSKAYVRQAVAAVDRQTLRVDAHTEAVRRSLTAAQPASLELTASSRDTTPEELEQAAYDAVPVAPVVPMGSRAVAETELAPNIPANIREHPAQSVFGFAASPNVTATVRGLLAGHTDNAAVVGLVLAEIPNANPASVAAIVRRERANITKKES